MNTTTNTTTRLGRNTFAFSRLALVLALPAVLITCSTDEKTTSPTLAAVGNVSGLSYTVGTSITAITFTNTGGPITTCTATPTLPTGLIIGQTTCTISGNPAAATPSAAYRIPAPVAQATPSR